MTLPPEIWGTWPAKDLTTPERELLKAAAQSNGELAIVPGQAGRVVRVGGKAFDDPSDPAVRARYVEAFEKLWRRALILYEAGGIYTLSGSGFEQARQASKAGGGPRFTIARS